MTKPKNNRFFDSPRVSRRQTVTTESQKRDAVARWIELRPSVGSSAAARIVGFNDRQIAGWARERNIPVPPLKTTRTTP